MAAFGTRAAGDLRGDVFHGRVHAQGQKRVGENGRFRAAGIDGVVHRGRAGRGNKALQRPQALGMVLTVPDHNENFVFYDNFSDLSH